MALKMLSVVLMEQVNIVLVVLDGLLTDICPDREHPGMIALGVLFAIAVLVAMGFGLFACLLIWYNLIMCPKTFFNPYCLAAR